MDFGANSSACTPAHPLFRQRCRLRQSSSSQQPLAIRGFSGRKVRSGVPSFGIVGASTPPRPCTPSIASLRASIRHHCMECNILVNRNRKKAWSNRNHAFFGRKTSAKTVSASVRSRAGRGSASAGQFDVQGCRQPVRLETSTEAGERPWRQEKTEEGTAVACGYGQVRPTSAGWKGAKRGGRDEAQLAFASAALFPLSKACRALGTSLRRFRVWGIKNAHAGRQYSLPWPSSNRFSRQKALSDRRLMPVLRFMPPA